MLHFREHGKKAIEKVAREQPAAYMKILALLVPREMKIEHIDRVKGLSDEQLEAMISHLEERIARRTDQAKLIEGQAVEITALPAPVEALKPRQPNEVMVAADTAIGPRERKARKRKVPSPPSAR